MSALYAFEIDHASCVQAIPPEGSVIQGLRRDFIDGWRSATLEALSKADEPRIGAPAVAFI